MAQVHRYHVELAWRGSTAAGYRSYDRGHTVRTPPAEAELALTADPAFRGDPQWQNPEQLLLAAASSCQLLAFLAVAARAGVEVLAYEDTAEAELPVTAGPMRISEIRLRPAITVAPGTDVERVVRLVEQGHRECYIANSLTAEIRIEPAVYVAD